MDLEPELKDLIDELLPVSDKYYFIGIQLGIRIEILKKIEKDHNETYRRFVEVLTYWLGNGESISWDSGSIISALESPSVGNKTLAATLINKYTTSRKITSQGRFCLTTAAINSSGMCYGIPKLTKFSNSNTLSNLLHMHGHPQMHGQLEMPVA